MNPTTNGIFHDPDAEARILGTVLLDWRKHWPEGLTCDHFYDERHRLVWAKIVDLHADGSPIEVTTVKDALPQAHWPYLSALPDDVPADPELPHFVNRLHDALFVRRIREAARLGTAMETLTATRRAVSALEKTVRDESDLPAIETADEMLADDSPELPVLIDGILHQGTKLALGGSSKSNKTWVLLDMGISVATGTQFMGLETRNGRVLYINFEIHRKFFQKRFKAVCKAKGATPDGTMFDHWCLRGHATGVEFLIGELLRRIEGRNYALVIIDPTYKLMGDHRDENKAADISTLLNAFDRIAVKTGAAVAFGAHFSKGNQAGRESIDRISGSGVFARDPDSIITLTRHEQDNAFVVEPVLRNFPPIEPFCVEWQYPLMARTDKLDPAKLRQPKGRPAVYSEDEVYKLLPATGLTTREWQTMADVECGIARSTFHRLRKSLEVNRRVLKSKANDKWTPIVPKVSKVP